MLGFNHHQKYYLYTGGADMRKGYDGLSGLVRNEMEENPLNGSVYVFFNTSRTIVKILVWDHDGYVVYAKRLERGRFEQITKGVSSKKYPVQYQHLVMLLSGISLMSMKQRPRYRMSKTG